MQLKMTKKRALGLFILSNANLLSACFSSGNSLQSGSIGVVNGTVMGGLSPIAGSEVSLYETVNSGPVLLAKTTSSANGTFQLHYAVPPLGSYAYIVAQGGSTAGAANNPNINLVSLLGEGPTVATQATVNEFTTVASYQTFDYNWNAALPVPSLSLSHETAAALANSFGAYQGMTNIATGSFNLYSINTTIGEQLAVQANVLALCVQNAAECHTLQGTNYLNTSNPDTFSLMASLKYASSTVIGSLNTLLSQNSSTLPYPRTLLTQSTLGNNFVNTFNIPLGAVTDNLGNMWFTSRGNQSLSAGVTELKKNSDGTTTTEIFSGSNYGFVNSGAISADQDANIWVANGNNTITEIKNEGNGVYRPVIFSASQGGYVFNTPSGVTADAYGNIWVTNAGAGAGANTVTEIKNNDNGTYSPVIFSSTQGGYIFSSPIGVASDSNGCVWVANKGNNTVTEEALAKFTKRVDLLI